MILTIILIAIPVVLVPAIISTHVRSYRAYMAALDALDTDHVTR